MDNAEFESQQDASLLEDPPKPAQKVQIPALKPQESVDKISEMEDVANCSDGNKIYCLKNNLPYELLINNLIQGLDTPQIIKTRTLP